MINQCFVLLEINQDRDVMRDRAVHFHVMLN